MLILVFEFSVDGGLLVMLVEGATWKLCGQEQNEPILIMNNNKKNHQLQIAWEVHIIAASLIRQFISLLQVLRAFIKTDLMK